MAEYTTVAELQARLGQDVDSTLLQNAISASARAIEDATDRVFDIEPVASQRQFRVVGNTTADPDGQLLLIDDIGDLADVVVEAGDGTDWAAVTDFFPEPVNALAKDRPVTKLRRDRGVWSGDPRVRVTARWGWPSVPETIKDANRILATRLFRRKDAWAGVAGFGETGLARLQETDPDVALMLGPYVRVGA